MVTRTGTSPKTGRESNQTEIREVREVLQFLFFRVLGRPLSLVVSVTRGQESTRDGSGRSRVD